MRGGLAGKAGPESMVERAEHCREVFCRGMQLMSRLERACGSAFYLGSGSAFGWRHAGLGFRKRQFVHSVSFEIMATIFTLWP